MKPKFWQTKEFRELEKEWYLKLAGEKFPDIEKEINGEGGLKQRASNCYRGASLTEVETRARYYELLAQGVHNELEFRDGVEKYVMEQRSMGITITQIAVQLKQLGERCHRETVAKIIWKYEAKWCVKTRQRAST